MTIQKQFISPNNLSAKRPRVLLVDDMPQVLYDLRQLLELGGNIEIIGTAFNGQEAVQMAEEYRPDVVVMDLDMPVMDGYRATRLIKSRLPACRVVILSIHAGSEEQACARSNGADEFVIKGACYELLLDAILGRKEKSEQSPDEKKGKIS